MSKLVFAVLVAKVLSTPFYSTSPRTGGSSIVVDIPESCCASGGRWCLHDAVVNTRPHKPNAYDLERDYQIFEPAPRALQTDFLDATLPW